MNAIAERSRGDLEFQLRCQVARLERENERMTDRIIDLEATFGISDDTARWAVLGLTVHQARIMNALMKAEIATPDQLCFALYGYGAERDQRGIRALDVHIFNIRKKLAPHGVVIEQLLGRGRRISPKGKQLLAELLKVPA